MKVIGITGTLGAGKGTISQYLVEKKGFVHYSVSDYISEEVKKRGLEVNRDTMYEVGWDLKKTYGPDYIVKELYKKAKQTQKNAIIESIRSPGEIIGLKQLDDFIVLAVDADQRIRYQRIRLRNSVKDQVDFETFVANEAREMQGSDEDPSKINLAACMAMADYTIRNDGTFEELYAQVENIITQLGI